jgi:hypothetical protein
MQLVQLRLQLRHLLLLLLVLRMLLVQCQQVLLLVLLAARKHSWCCWVADKWLLVPLRLWFHCGVGHLCRPNLLRRLHLLCRQLLHVLLLVWLLTCRGGEVLHEVLGHWH